MCVAKTYIRGTGLLQTFTFNYGARDNRQYYLQNAHGDVVNLLNTDGAVTKTYHYDAFGVEKNIDSNDDNAFRYCGEYFDKETGTIYLRARYYDPSIGRFISRDSYAGKIQDPLSLNLYTYCHNNPILGTDPSGHSIKKQLSNSYQAMKAYIPKKSVEVCQKVATHVKPVIKSGVLVDTFAVSCVQHHLSKINITYSSGTTVSGSLLFIKGSISSGWSIDTKGNIDLQYTIASGVELDPVSVGVSQYATFTNASSVEDLKGAGANYGASVSVNGVGLGIDRVQGGETIGKSPFDGFSLSGGISSGVSPVDVNWQYGKTYSLLKKPVNIFDEYYKLANKIIGW